MSRFMAEVREAESWDELQRIGLNKLRDQQYAEYQTEKKRQFLSNLGG